MISEIKWQTEEPKEILGTCELCRKAIYEESDFHMDSEGVEVCDECYQEIMKE